MDATVESLIEVGYRGTSLQVIEDRSSVSHGALMHQFGSRTELLIAAVHHVGWLQAEQMRQDAEAIARKQGVGGLLELMWRQYESPVFYAYIELWNAARTDRDLHAALVVQERAFGEWGRQTGADMFGVEPTDPSFVTALELTIVFMRGAALTSIISSKGNDRERLITEWRELVSPLFRRAKVRKASA